VREIVRGIDELNEWELTFLDSSLLCPIKALGAHVAHRTATKNPFRKTPLLSMGCAYRP
jgi:hypothetical protein